MSAVSVPFTAPVVVVDDLAGVPDDVRHFGAKQIAEIWTLSKSRVDKAFASGELKSRKILGCRRASLRDLREFLENEH